MENQRKTVLGTSSPAPTPAQPKMLHNFQLPGDLKWCKSTGTNFLRSRRQGKSSSSSASPQKQRSPAPQPSVLLKHMLGQNFQAACGAPASGSSSRYPSPSVVSDKESRVIDVLSNGFMLVQNKGKNEERESVRTERFSMTLPSPEKMIDQFKKGLTVSEKQGRKEKKVNIRKKPESDKVEEELVPRSEEDKELEKEDLEAPCTKKRKPLARKDEEILPKMDDKESPNKIPNKYYQEEDEDKQIMTVEFGESVGIPWNLRPRKPNQRPKVSNPCEVVRSSKLGGKSAAQRRSKMQEAIGNDKKGKEKHKGGKEKREKGKDKGREKSNNIPITPNFSLTLTPEEIAEDLFAMTGRKPSKKFKKRDKTVQQTLDQVFPGMQLKDITPDDYSL